MADFFVLRSKGDGMPADVNPSLLLPEEKGCYFG
jgi:hypothetical protein